MLIEHTFQVEFIELTNFTKLSKWVKPDSSSFESFVNVGSMLMMSILIMIHAKSFILFIQLDVVVVDCENEYFQKRHIVFIKWFI